VKGRGGGGERAADGSRFDFTFALATAFIFRSPALPARS
jgi:hypothetical protein